MAGYEDTKQKIISTLMGRPVGTEIQPENHQDYALNMLDYIRSLELIATSTLIGVAESNTTPVQPNDSRVCYIAGVAQNQTVTFENFIAQNGNPISITTGDMEGVFVILLWNTQYWNAQMFSTNIISQSESATFYYRYNIRKTYASIALMNADVESPIGTDGKYIKVGDLVSVVNTVTPSENGIFSYEGNNWKYQGGFNFQLSQTTGNDPDIAMSQEAVSKEINWIKSGGLNDKSIELTKLSSTLISFIGSSGEVINQADDEDLENENENGLSVIRKKTIKFYSPENYSGYGKIILRKNMLNSVNVLSQSMINQSNTIYEIGYDFDLDGETINMPENCLLYFNGGSIKNGSINGNGTKIRAELYNIFGLNTNLLGSYNINGLYPEWFGAVGDGITDCTINFIKLSNQKLPIIIPNSTYVISDTVFNSIKYNFQRNYC